MTDENLELCRDQLVEAMLVHVPFDGWAWSALEAGAKDLGQEPGDARLAFTDGMGEVAAPAAAESSAAVDGITATAASKVAAARAAAPCVCTPDASGGAPCAPCRSSTPTS